VKTFPTFLFKKLKEDELSLDVGSGSEHFGLICLGDINIDIGKHVCKSDKPFVRCDATFLPFTDNLFAQVTMFDVIEHVDSPCRVLKEIKRVMTNDGRLILGTPNILNITVILHTLLHGFYVPHNDHVSAWGRLELDNLMRRVGFRRFKVFAYTYDDTKHSFLALVALKFFAFRKDFSGRQLVAVAEKRGD
jgi:SAM-dependent methyltransferase